MLTIFCGDNSIDSREKFLSFKSEIEKKHQECVYISNTDINDFTKKVEGSSSLFAIKQVYFLENVLTKKLFRDVLKKYDSQDRVEIILWENKAEERDIKRYFKNACVKSSKLPINVWKLLDSLYPGNVLTVLKYNEIVHQSSEEVFILYLIQQRIKELILIRNSLPGKGKRAPWQESLLMAQTRKWEESMLMQFNKKLFDIESGIKTSTLPYSSKKALDILFCFYLQ